MTKNNTTLEESEEPLSDEELMSRFVQGDSLAFFELHQRHLDMVYRIAKFKLGHVRDFEDVVQNVFMIFYQKAALFRGESSLKTWLTTITINEVNQVHRKILRDKTHREKVIRENPMNENIKPLQEKDPEKFTLVQRILNKLPKHYSTPLWLRYYEGLSQKDVASSLGLSESTVHSQLSRGMKILREKLSLHDLKITSTACLAILTKIPKPKAPSALKLTQKGFEQLEASSVAATSASTALSSKALTSWSVRKTAALLFIATSIATGTYFFITKDSLPPSSYTSSSSITEKDYFFKEWFFDQKETSWVDFQQEEGSFNWLKKSGVGKSGCLELYTDKNDPLEPGLSIISFNFDVTQLPIVIEYRTNLVWPKGELLAKNGQKHYGSWSQMDRSLTVYGLTKIATLSFSKNSSLPLKSQQWRRTKIYFSQDHVQQWQDGKLVIFTQCEVKENALPIIVFNGRYRVDDLKCSQIDASEVPSLEKYEKHLSKIKLPEKNGGFAKVPVLIDGKEVKMILSVSPARP